MGDMENRELQGQGAEQQEQQQAGNQGENQQQEKTFTQEQVNKIVEERLARERNKYENIRKGMSPEAAELTEREKNLTRREMTFEAKEKLQEMGLPLEAVGLLNLESSQTVKESTELLIKIMRSAIEAHVEARLRGGKPPKEAMNMVDNEDSVMRAAFGL